MTKFYKIRINHMIRIMLVLGIIITISKLGFSQNLEYRCAFDGIHVREGMFPTEHIVRQAVAMESASRSSHTTKIIPVVVHVIHNGGTENISEAQIQSQIQILNEDFGKISGTNGDGNGVDMKIRYCLAKIDPDGNCTNGIVRLETPLADHKTYQRATLKELSFWDNTKYLNMYVVKSITGNVGGYASFPGGPADEDGIVVRHNLFGNTGSASSSLGRTTTHEIGHWFGLYHTFNNSCGTDTCTDGDFICDTPPVFEPNFACPANTNSCDNDFPDLNDQIENYLDYTNDACKSVFTAGQKERANATLSAIRTNIWSDQNLAITGCDSNYTPPAACPVFADFVTLSPEICNGNSAYFIDKSLNQVNTWFWEFEGGNPQNSSLQNPTILYDSTGIFSVSLTVTDSNGNSHSLTFADYINVSAPSVGRKAPIAEDFESGLYPPKNLSIVNYDAGITWELDSIAAASGKYSIKINNLINTNYGSADELVLPNLDFSDLQTDSIVRLEFKWAYAKSDPTYSDELIVLLSTDCGQTFQQVFYRSQNGLATGPVQTTPFVPDSTQWRSGFAFLSNYRSETNVQIKFVNVTDGGNNLYLDDIYVGDGTEPLPVLGLENTTEPSFEFSVYPNPTEDEATISFSNNQNAKTHVTISNLQGQLLKSFDFNHLEESSGNYYLNTSELSKGIYLITATSNGTARSVKLIKL